MRSLKSISRRTCRGATLNIGSGSAPSCSFLSADPCKYLVKLIRSHTKWNTTKVIRSDSFSICVSTRFVPTVKIPLVEDVTTFIAWFTTRRICTVEWIPEQLFIIYEPNLWFSKIFDSIPISKNTVLVRRIGFGRTPDLSLSWSAAADMSSRFDPTMKIRFVKDENAPLSDSATRRTCTVGWNLMLIIRIYELNLWFSKFFRSFSDPKDDLFEDWKLIWCKSLVKSTGVRRARFYEGLPPN